MSSGGKFFVTLWGGVGDFLKMYYNHDQWRKLESFKKRHPHCNIKALVYSLNPTAKDLITYHSAIDSVFQPEEGLIEVRTKGLGAYANGREWLHNQTRLLRPLKQTKARIFLSSEDASFVNDILQQTEGKYIVIHPFSAMNPKVLTSRTTMTTDKYIPIIEGLNKKGYKVVLLGASRETQKEEFNYESDRTINLINKTSIRSALSLVTKANGFIGTNSCFMCQAMLEKKPCFVITSYFWKDRVHKNGFIAKGLKESRSQFVFLPQNRSEAPYKQIQQKATNWFK